MTEFQWFEDYIGKGDPYLGNCCVGIACVLKRERHRMEVAPLLKIFREMPTWMTGENGWAAARE